MEHILYWAPFKGSGCRIAFAFCWRITAKFIKSLCNTYKTQKNPIFVRNLTNILYFSHFIKHVRERAFHLSKVIAIAFLKPTDRQDQTHSCSLYRSIIYIQTGNNHSLRPLQKYPVTAGICQPDAPEISILSQSFFVPLHLYLPNKHGRRAFPAAVVLRGCWFWLKLINSNSKK